MYRALVPSAAMETLISTVSPGVLLGTGGSSKQPYGCLHARIEEDLRRNAMWNEISEMHFAFQTESKLYTQSDDPAGEYERRKDLGY